MNVLTDIDPTLVDTDPPTIAGLTIDVINVRIKIKNVKNVEKCGNFVPTLAFGL